MESVNKPKVSVIIPVYNVESFVERCAHSLFGQTLDSLEYIFVDDCSPDNSISVIKQVLDLYPHRKTQVIFLHHESNQGQAAARTTGMKAASGEYMIHCDPDDWVELDMYEKLYRAAHPLNKEPIDIVGCDFVLHQKGYIEPIPFIIFDNPQDYIINLYKHSLGLYSLCNKLIKSELIRDYDIYPIQGIDYGEDRNVSIRAYFYAKSIIVVSQGMYHYDQTNINSITKRSFSKELWKEWKKNVDYISDFLLSKNSKFRRSCNYLKYEAKSRFYGTFEDEKEWFYTYCECHKDINYFVENTSRGRIILSIIMSNYLFYSFYKFFKQL